MANVQVTTSKRFSLKLSDWTRGLLVAVITGPVTIILDSLNEGSLTFAWRKIAIVALSAGLSYVAKNWLLTPNEVTIKNVHSETLKAVDNGDATAKVVQK